MALRFCTLGLTLSLGVLTTGQYEPNWGSIDSRPIPSWFDKAKVGIFIHWGPYSVPSFSPDHSGAEWYWDSLVNKKKQAWIDFQASSFGEGSTYQDFGPLFKAEFFDPDAMAAILKSSGAEYVVLTSKHHDGWTNWQSPEAWNWNSVENGPHRDLAGELAKAVRAAGLHYGLYYSLFEWFHPFFLEDKANNFQTTRYVDEVMLPQLHEIVEAYEPDVIWADGDWMADSNYWKSTQFLSWLYNNAPNKDVVCVNDRWGNDTRLKHGGYYSGPDRYHPGQLQSHKWEMAMTIDSTSWGYARNRLLSNYLTVHELLTNLVQTVAFGGNILINIGPGADGTVAPIFQARLQSVGDFLKVNGEAIYKSVPWKVQNETAANAYFTSAADGNTVYTHVIDWPEGNTLDLLTVTPQSTTSTVQLLGTNGPSDPLTWSYISTTKKIGLSITLPRQPTDREHGFVFSMVGMAPSPSISGAN